MMRSVTQYVAGYILKGKWQNNDSQEKQTKSEWALMSRNPYIGSPAVKSLSEKYLTAKGARRCAKLGTIPNSFHYNGRRYQLPTRIRKEVAAYLGYPLLPLLEDGQKQTYKQAKAKTNKIAKSIRQRRKLNITQATG